MDWEFVQCNQQNHLQCLALNSPGILQAITAKESGNMALHTGDSPEAVIKRRRNFLNCYRLDLKDLVAARQIHGERIEIIKKRHSGRGSISEADLIPETDALITGEPGIILSVFTADCVPIFIHDPVKKVIAVVHAGWRGTIAGIASKTVFRMCSEFQTNPKHCIVGIGPAICKKCFQVNSDLADIFSNVFPETVTRVENKSFVDLVDFNSRILQKAGIPEKSIFLSEQCTCCAPQKWYSYRASATTGRIMGIIALTGEG